MEPIGPTEHLETVDYWKGLYLTAIEVGQEKMNQLNRTNKIYIVAGNFRQANEWAREARIPPSKFVYVENVSRLRGVSDPVVAYVGTWRDRKDLPEIAQALEFIRELIK